MVSRPYDCVIQNIVATASLKEYTEKYGKFDLRKFVAEYPSVEYKPITFPAVVFRLKNPESTTLIFATGNLVNTATKSEHEPKKAISKVVKKLRRVYKIEFKIPEVIIQNIVASINFRYGVELEKLVEYISDYYQVTYEPEQFPGAIIRPRKRERGVVLVFASGKGVCPGTRSANELYEILDELYDKLYDRGLFFKI